MLNTIKGSLSQPCRPSQCLLGLLAPYACQQNISKMLVTLYLALLGLSLLALPLFRDHQRQHWCWCPQTLVWARHLCLIVLLLPPRDLMPSPSPLTMTPIWMVKISPQNQRSQSQPWLKLQCQYHKISHQLSRLMITTTWKMNSWWRAAQLLTSKSFSFLFLTSWAKKKDTCNASHVSKLCFLSFFYLFISYDSVL